MPLREPQTLDLAEQRLAVVRQTSEQPVVQREREGVVLHALADVGAQRQSRDQRRELVEHAGESLVGRHQAATREFGLARQHVDFGERGMRRAEGREVLDR